MTLLREIQEAATDSTVAISTVLRKAKILAARLQNPEFESWVDSELNGYPERTGLPPYRKIGVVVQGLLSDGYRQWNGAPIMTSFLPEKLKDWGASHYLNEPISTIASMAEDDGDGSMLQCPWPQELAVKFGSKGYNGFECLGAWQIINRSSLVGVIEQVRNRVLEFALKIEAAAPGAGETPAGSAAPIPQETITQIFNTYVYGSANNIASGGSHFSQRAVSEIKPGNLESLLQYMRELGIPDADVKALARVAESHPDPKAAAEGWLGKLAMSAATGAMSTSVGLAAKAIAHYFGISIS
jgi:hypothetical protein